MNPQLTQEQRRALQKSYGAGPVSVEDSTTHTTYVLVRADVYERNRPEIDIENPRATYPFIDQALQADDAHDPLLEGYQRMVSLPAR